MFQARTARNGLLRRSNAQRANTRNPNTNISLHVVSDPRYRRRSTCSVAVFAQARKLSRELFSSEFIDVVRLESLANSLPLLLSALLGRIRTLPFPEQCEELSLEALQLLSVLFGLRREHASVCGLNGLTGVQLSVHMDPRLIVFAARRRGQGFGSVLEERGPFDLMLIMARTYDLAMGVAPGMVLYSIEALHTVCQMGGVRTVALREPRSFFTFEESEGTTGVDVDVCGDAREARLSEGTLTITAFQKG